eukprot:TRINITY_DN48506_c0_g1_i1.p1 TRINITY_DN48506_c0_g1~~TRINITY_DN48506_c0_g1_i1.p1  ORF type:complete len:482 (-),score=53.13 TRINITY_DN48506_c0_g1_i1:135-1517(-)
MATATNESAGSIGDLFTSLGTAPPVLDERFADLKSKLQPSAEKLASAWQRLETTIAAEVAEIKRLGSDVIPSVEFKDIEANGGTFPQEVAEAVRKRGCVVVRNTVEENVALAMKTETQDYIASNKEHLAGFPAEKPQVWEVYWSKPQGRMRQHPNLLKTQTALNRLWHCRALSEDQGQVNVDVHRPVTYGERLRIRSAGDTSFTLGPHVDGGSVERWEDDTYRACYQDILACDWERHDAWDATHRANARCDMYNLHIGACTVFRSFQGWLSLSNSGQGRGALMVVPLVREATSFLMLRPFLEDVPPTSFCGANPGKTQDLYPEFHKLITEGLVAMPDVRPGDSVWWHCDLIHAVEGAHGGTEDSSVFYIPALPLCRKNADYLQVQASNFKEGKTPPDFPPNHSEVPCTGRFTTEDLDELGLVAMGFAGVPAARVDGESEDDYAASKALREDCQQILSKLT